MQWQGERTPPRRSGRLRRLKLGGTRPVRRAVAPRHSEPLAENKTSSRIPHCGEEPEYSTIKTSNLQTQYISFLELDHFHGYGPCMIFLIPPPVPAAGAAPPPAMNEVFKGLLQPVLRALQCPVCDIVFGHQPAGMLTMRLFEKMTPAGPPCPSRGGPARRRAGHSAGLYILRVSKVTFPGSRPRYTTF